MAHGGGGGARPAAVGIPEQDVSMAVPPITTPRRWRLAKRAHVAARLATVGMIDHRPLASCS
jgi:hypothetical protein